jgi:low temperature requirement protein LtrA
MDDRQAERGQRVTPLELFFDLVVVFAITQVTSFLSQSPTWGGFLRGLLLLGALWWAWAGYAWWTNNLDPEEGAVRLAMFAATASMLVVSLAVPGAFGSHGVTFGVAYFIARALLLVLYAIAGRGDRDLLRAVVRIVPAGTLGPALLVVSRASSTIHGSSGSGAPPWRSTTSVSCSATSARGGSRRITSSSAPD